MDSLIRIWCGHMNRIITPAVDTATTYRRETVLEWRFFRCCRCGYVTPASVEVPRVIGCSYATAAITVPT